MINMLQGLLQTRYKVCITSYYNSVKTTTITIEPRFSTCKINGAKVKTSRTGVTIGEIND